MKYMIASDLHGSAYYCAKMEEAYRREEAERMILLGDLLYHGPRNDLPKDYEPKDVIQILNNMKAELLCVRGNCDAEVDQMVLEFPVMAEYMIWNLEKHMVFATHGHVYHEDNMPPLKEGDILLHGHTHIPAMEKRGSYYYLNPGSISIPKGGNQHSYMLYVDSYFVLKNLESEVIAEFKLPTN